MKSFLLISFCSIYLVGCASSVQIAQSASSGKMECSPNEILVTNVQAPSTFSYARSWNAQCKGKKYNCSGATDGYGAFVNVSCTQVGNSPPVKR